ncbi:PREDICTED: defensin-like protein 76 [Camelina sativa]|uniref:Defensin-like protein 76 n=1 Tax=Camelina sativa TaxID=90675 RepID=A0ABM1QN95_CAMSA|nr:PREDICTED: defensin-like protein 76 [Camelina sativa]XP_019088230.1 PREDICTED: defensin-like protein 76 [Camelina sativa]XP_019088233.1 PREDICTED: defensin-like protein 76 [Camelina sativa]XP_019088237.1 PREDICTED: defensin-like protein 76 [Camelina sativa]XP_019088239.1 PREDICTED: defensin-like protein 76 [Camelina sativa]
MQDKKHLHIFIAIAIVLLIVMAGKINAIDVHDAVCFRSECTSVCDQICLSKGFKNGWYCGTFRLHTGCCCLKEKEFYKKISPSEN